MTLMELEMLCQLTTHNPDVNINDLILFFTFPFNFFFLYSLLLFFTKFPLIYILISLLLTLYEFFDVREFSVCSGNPLYSFIFSPCSTFPLAVSFYHDERL